MSVTSHATASSRSSSGGLDRYVTATCGRHRRALSDREPDASVAAGDECDPALRSLRAPAQHCAGGRHTGPEADEQDQVAVVTRSLSRASARASGIDADEVLPVRCEDHRRPSMAMPSFFMALSMIRIVGLVGDDRSMSARDAGSVEAASAESDHGLDGLAEDLFALHLQVAADLGVEDVAKVALAAEVPAQQLAGPSVASSTTAPAPSANKMQVPRSVQSVMRESVSEPMTGLFSAPAPMMPWAVTRP